MSHLFVVKRGLNTRACGELGLSPRLALPLLSLTAVKVGEASHYHNSSVSWGAKPDGMTMTLTSHASSEKNLEIAALLRCSNNAGDESGFEKIAPLIVRSP